MFGIWWDDHVLGASWLPTILRDGALLHDADKRMAKRWHRVPFKLGMPLNAWSFNIALSRIAHHRRFFSLDTSAFDSTIPADVSASKYVLHQYYTKILRMGPLPWERSVVPRYSLAQFMSVAGGILPQEEQHASESSASPTPRPERWMMSSFSLDFDLINMADDNVVGQNK